MMTQDEESALSRPQRRLLRRIYNGRTTPIVADGRSFLTYKDAARYLLSLPTEARDAAYAAMKAHALAGGAADVAAGLASDATTA